MMNRTDHLKFCTERGRLTDDLGFAASDYAREVTEMAERIGLMPEAEYRRVCSKVKRARITAQDARNALLQHRQVHGC